MNILGWTYAFKFDFYWAASCPVCGFGRSIDDVRFCGVGGRLMVKLENGFYV